MSRSSQPAGTPQRPATATPRAPESLFQVVDQIRLMVFRGQPRLRVQLQPADLGHLEIEARQRGRGLMATITTESAQVKSLLESHLSWLRQSLADQGLKFERIEMVLQEDLESSSFEERQDQDADSQRHSPREQDRGQHDLDTPTVEGEDGADSPAPDRFHTIA